MSVQPASATRMPRPRFMRANTDTGALKPAPALRLLPIVIIAAVFMLGFRIQVVVRDFTNFGLDSVELGQSALAQAQNAPVGAAPAQPAGANPAPAAPSGQVAADDSADPASELAESADANAPPLPINFDPTTLTKSEIDTLQRLAERRDMIVQRERELEAKEGLIKAAESRIDGKIAQLQDLERNIQGLLKQYDGQKQAEIEQLVRIYGAMKPKDAARIFDTLEMPILVAVIQSMKETKVAPIMAMMESQKATALTEELTARKQLPTAGPPG
jgi:flagellar motility protein MotE (MotC chaperone)